MKTMRFSMPSSTLMPAVVRKRGTSRGAGSSTKSISPEISAARRVASLLIWLNTISCTLPSYLPHQAGLRL